VVPFSVDVKPRNNSLGVDLFRSIYFKMLDEETRLRALLCAHTVQITQTADVKETTEEAKAKRP